MAAFEKLASSESALTRERFTFKPELRASQQMQALWGSMEAARKYSARNACTGNRTASLWGSEAVRWGLEGWDIFRISEGAVGSVKDMKHFHNVKSNQKEIAAE